MSNKFKKKKIYKNKVIAWVNQDNLCLYCGKYFKSPDLGTAEHLVPVSHNGSSNSENIAFACLRCNSKRGTKAIASSIKTKRVIFRNGKDTLSLTLRRERLYGECYA